MQYFKNRTNNIIVHHIKSNDVPHTSRTWKLVYHSRATNKQYIINVPDVSPYPNSYHQFIVDDTIYQLPKGIGVLNVYEVNTTTNDEYLYEELIMNVVESTTVKEYTNTNTDIKIYNK